MAETHRTISPHPHELQVDAELVERMAQRSVLYLNSFDTHSAAIRGEDKETIADMYNKAMESGSIPCVGPSQRQFSDSELTSHEKLLNTPAHTTYDHVLASLVAHGLLVSHLSVIRSLPPDTVAGIDARTVELRSPSKARGKGQPRPGSQFGPLVLPPPLPEFVRPATHSITPLDETDIRRMLASPKDLMGRVFVMKEDDIFYRVVGIEMSMDARTFHLQYEDVTSADDISELMMKQMLEDSFLVNLPA